MHVLADKGLIALSLETFRSGTVLEPPARANNTGGSRGRAAVGGASQEWPVATRQ
jgi:hypothetical protein